MNKPESTNSAGSTEPQPDQELKAWIFDIQRYSINDGPGIRTTVFFKGCPFRCLWCDNPESQSRLPQLFYFKSLCVGCQRCVSVCPNQAISVAGDGAIITDRSRCKACGACTVVCPNEARVITGRLYTVDEVVTVIKQDTPFYRNSGGGMTASGGEAASQADFLIELLRRCQETGIHTTLDTTGYVEESTLEKILAHTDLVLLDIKHMDPDQHLACTGVDNALILSNACKIAARGIPLWIRFPLIPGVTDSSENIVATGKLVLDLGLNHIDILPYHRLGTAKYERLGMAYPLPDIVPYSQKRLDEIRAMLENLGLEVREA